MEESEKSLIVIILSWVIRYASYAALSFAVLHCVGIITISYLAVSNNPDFSFMSNLGVVNPEFSNPEATIDENDILDVFMLLFTVLTIITELGGFLIKKFLKKDLTMSFKQKFWLGSYIIAGISMLGLLVIVISLGWMEGMWIMIVMFIMGMIVSIISLLLFLTLRYISRMMQQV